MYINNLHKANALDTNDDNFSKEKIYQGIHIAVADYRRYIDSCISTIEKTGATSIRVNKQKHKKEDQKKDKIHDYKVSFQGKNDKEKAKLKDQLYKNEIRHLYTDKPTGNYTDDEEFKIEIMDRNEEELTLTFDFPINTQTVYLKPNTSSLIRQKMALRQFKDYPIKEYTPLQKLFDNSDKSVHYFANSYNSNSPIKTWHILKDASRDGTKEQRTFVEKAINTEDFAILEGPPGSGKTTAIIEEITQHIKRGERVLLVSSTHVAVDNVLDRIINAKDEWKELITPLRIGDLGNIRKEDVKPYQLKNLTRKMRADIKRNLEKKESTKSRNTMLKCIDSENDDAFDDIILKSANLVAGTMIGILQHPDIRKDGFKELFDVMIVDESSKVTFLDFIVPALHAKKWILVGDKNQLPPFNEDDFIVEYLRQLTSKEEQQKNVRLYNINKNINSPQNKGCVNIIFSHNTDADFDYFQSSDKIVITLDKSYRERALELNSADIIIAQNTKEHRNILGSQLKVKTMMFESEIKDPAFKARQQHYHFRKNKHSSYYNDYVFSSKDIDWAEITAQKLSNMYQYRFDKKECQYLKNELDELCSNDELKSKIETIRKLAFPSILELLQIGIGETFSKHDVPQHKIIYDGFNKHAAIKTRKFQTLSYQHRMQATIAEISKKHFYANENLLTANTVSERVNILQEYRPEEEDVIWISNPKKGWQEKNHNSNEVEDIKDTLEEFITYAKNDTYEIAILTFYRDQEKLLRTMLQKLTKSSNKSNFKKNNIKLTLCTVDKFQGDEADLVLLSFTVAKRRAFYNNPNRLNVALTRARYKLILFGNRQWLAKDASSPALRDLASNYDRRLKR